MSHFFTRLFSSSKHSSVGLHIAGSRVRLIALVARDGNMIPVQVAETALPEGSVERGHIINIESFVSFFKNFRTLHRFDRVHLAIREPEVISSDPVETIPKKNVVPSATAAKATRKRYIEAFTRAGIIVDSFEYDSQAVARAVVPSGTKGLSMIVDIGASETSLSITSNGMAIYTAPIVFGGSMIITALTDELGISIEEAHQVRRDHGLSSSGAHKDIFCAMEKGIAILRNEIDMHYIDWCGGTKKKKAGPAIDTVYLSGEYGSLQGLSEYLGASLKLHVVRADPWVNCLSYDQVIPILSADESLIYTAAIGAALQV